MKIPTTTTRHPLICNAKTPVSKKPIRYPSFSYFYFTQLKHPLLSPLLLQTMTRMLWAVPMNRTRRTKRSGAPASLISGRQTRATCLPSETVAYVLSCCVRNASVSGPNSSPLSEKTDYRWAVPSRTTKLWATWVTKQLGVFIFKAGRVIPQETCISGCTERWLTRLLDL